MVLINVWLNILRIILFGIRAGPKFLQDSEQESGKSLQQLLGASSGLVMP